MGAEEFLPASADLSELSAAAAGCHGCDLYERATQTVFGEGSDRARLLLVGEQPGHEEDLDGQPFVGPAGRLLDECLGRAGIGREELYVTNIVKHFKWEQRGPRRLHKKPSAREVRACRPWLDREIDAVKPRVILCLGATAAQGLLGAAVRVTLERGRPRPGPAGADVLVTVHPAALLRTPDTEARHREVGLFVQDLVQAGRLAGIRGPS